MFIIIIDQRNTQTTIQNENKTHGVSKKKKKVTYTQLYIDLYEYDMYTLYIDIRLIAKNARVEYVT